MSESHSVTQHSQNIHSPPCLPSSSSCPVSFTHACARTHTYTFLVYVCVRAHACVKETGQEEEEGRQGGECMF